MHNAQLAHDLGGVQQWQNGPVVKFADGRRARLRKKTPTLTLMVPIRQDSRTKTYHCNARFAVLPGRERRLFLGQREIRQLQSAMRAHGQDPSLPIRNSAAKILGEPPDSYKGGGLDDVDSFQIGYAC